jgi:hypothetical protein
MRLRLCLVRATVAIVAIAASTFTAAADKDDFELRAEQLRSGPPRAPVSNETGFNQGLKCMDALFRNFGVKNVTVVIDEIPDATKKINVGARDMFMSATSQMTRTTHAIRLVPIAESRIFTESKRERVVADADYVIQGSISQFDDSMLQKQRDGAVCLWYLCIGAAESDAFSGLGLDLNLVETSGLTLVPGANVRNAVLIRKRGKGYDGDFTLKKWSIQYNFTLVSHDGNGQALRTLIDLGAIELFGRLLKLPYWTCLGASDRDPEVKGEIDDWWEEMAADPRDRARLFAYLQMQMKAQGVYDGEVNGRGDLALLRAVRAYRMAMGQPDDLNLDSNFLRKYLAVDHAEMRKSAALKLVEITQREGPLPPPPPPTAQNASPTVADRPGGSPAASSTPATVAQVQSLPPKAQVPPPALVDKSPASPVTQRSAPPVDATQSALAAAPTAKPAGPSVAAAATKVAWSPQPSSPGAAQPTGYRAASSVASIPMQGSRPANNAAYRAGEPFFVGVISPRDGYLYCYLVDDQQRISQFFPAPAQPFARVSSGALTVVNSGSPFVARASGRREEVACFSSPRDLGRQPLEVATINGGLDALKAKFAIAVSGAYAMGVFNVTVQ